MLIGVPRELLESENRVAATPKTVQQILKLGFDVIVEHDAGFKASFEDQAFIDAQIIGEIRYTDAKSKGVGNSSLNDSDLLRELIFKILH